MKVTKAQAQANREHVVATASTLFREHGYDGVGIADLMAAAGFTHGGFYKHFGSKADLMAEAAACGLAETAQMTAHLAPADLVTRYLSRAHRDARAEGCTMAALGADAARQPNQVRTVFAEGIERLVAALVGEQPDGEGAGEARARALAMLAQMAGALLLSRACPDDSPLANDVLAASRDELLAALSHGAQTPHPST